MLGCCNVQEFYYKNSRSRISGRRLPSSWAAFYVNDGRRRRLRPPNSEVESTGGGHILIEDRKKEASGGGGVGAQKEKCHFHFRPYCWKERRLRNILSHRRHRHHG